MPRSGSQSPPTWQSTSRRPGNTSTHRMPMPLSGIEAGPHRGQVSRDLRTALIAHVLDPRPSADANGCCSAPSFATVRWPGRLSRDHWSRRGAAQASEHSFVTNDHGNGPGRVTGLPGGVLDGDPRCGGPLARVRVHWSPTQARSSQVTVTCPRVRRSRGQVTVICDDLGVRRRS